MWTNEKERKKLRAASKFQVWMIKWILRSFTDMLRHLISLSLNPSFFLDILK